MYYAIINKIGTKTPLYFKTEETKLLGFYRTKTFKEMIYLLRQIARTTKYKDNGNGYYTVDMYNEKEYPVKTYLEIIIDNSTIKIYKRINNKVKIYIIRN